MMAKKKLYSFSSAAALPDHCQTIIKFNFNETKWVEGTADHVMLLRLSLHTRSDLLGHVSFTKSRLQVA